MVQTLFKIEGMTCGHCVKAVAGALGSLPGVSKAEVSLEEKRALVTHEGSLDLPAATAAVAAEGYKLTWERDNHEL